jgi:hypothetical protein
VLVSHASHPRSPGAKASIARARSNRLANVRDG